MTVITRFAPSPTGYLHIGGARTALFNCLFAKAMGGKYLLRIEDTDKDRSSTQAVDAIIDGLSWLGLGADGQPVFQSENINRHKEVVNQLLAQGKAYYCYTTPEELSLQRESAEKEGVTFKYNRLWRDNDTTPPAGVKPVVRLKCPLDGQTIIEDLIQGTVKLDNERLDDYILMRADETPTYMLSVVVDDIDMGITHIIRGDDHLNNTYRQYHLFMALGAKVPAFAHLPLIHGDDGKKLSKRHGAMAVDLYRDLLGYLPEAVNNYLSRLGWAHGDDELFTMEQAIEWFSLEGCGKSPSRLDFKKLDHVNAHYIKNYDEDALFDLFKDKLGDVSDVALSRLKKGLAGIKDRALSMNDFPELCQFYINAPVFPLADEKAQKMIKENSISVLKDVINVLENCSDWTKDVLETIIKEYIDSSGLKFGEVAQPMRATLSGTTKSPSIFELMEVLGKEESLKRLSALA